MRSIKDINIKDIKTNSQLGMRKQKIVSLFTETSMEDTGENKRILEECAMHWESLRDFRERRMRNRKYYRGDQWSDLVLNPDSTSDEWITEEEHIKNQGKVPLKQNQIRQYLKNLLGQFRSNPTRSVVVARQRDDARVSDMLSNSLEYASQINAISELDARNFEEFALSGAPIQKISYKYWKERNQEDVFIENINPNRIFFNTDLVDIRGKDLRLIGELIDTTVDEIVAVFAKDSRDESRIRELYKGILEHEFYRGNGLASDRVDNLSFYLPEDVNKARVIEVWRITGSWKIYAHDPLDGSYRIVDRTMDEIAEENANRILFYEQQGISKEEVPLIEASRKFEREWEVRYLTPEGHTLYKGITPYAHEEHPYALTLYPLLDGEVWGFVEDIIDQQRYINRLIIMLDFIMSASAKGVLMVPEDAIPDGMTEDDFAKEWTRFNGVIVYKPSKEHTQLPKQISSNSTNIGIHEMIALQMKLIQEISGVHGAIQGTEAKSGTPSSLYAQQAQNATINSLDYMETYQAFQKKRDMKMLKVITQFYKETRYLAINGRSFEGNTMIYDPEKVKDLDYDVTVTRGTDTPVYRQLIDDSLMGLLDKQLINLEMFLEHTSLPYADELLQSIKAQKEQVASGEVSGLEAGTMGDVAGQADPKAMELLNQMSGVA